MAALIYRCSCGALCTAELPEEGDRMAAWWAAHRSHAVAVAITLTFTHIPTEPEAPID